MVKKNKKTHMLTYKEMNPYMPDKHMNRIIFNRYGHDPFIDFLKGVCILFVIFSHCFPHKFAVYSLFFVWGTPAVPIFLIIQIFHTYKKGFDNITPNYTKLWYRILKPFLFTQLIIMFLNGGYLAIKGDLDIYGYMMATIAWGGGGPGCYYPWIYLQFAILLPIITPIFKHVKNNICLILIWIFIAEIIEIFCSIIGLAEYKYRLICFRYIFLIYLGYLLVVDGFILNRLTFFLSIVSITFVIIFNYTNISLYPFFCDTNGWKSCHWICYIYIAFLMLYIIKQLYHKLSGHKKIVEYFKKMGRYSYEIFLFQMFYFAVLSEHVIKFITNIAGSFFTNFISVPFATIICIVPVIYYKGLSN